MHLQIPQANNADLRYRQKDTSSYPSVWKFGSSKNNSVHTFPRACHSSWARTGFIYTVGRACHLSITPAHHHLLSKQASDTYRISLRGWWLRQMPNPRIWLYKVPSNKSKHCTSKIHTERRPMPREPEWHVKALQFCEVHGCVHYSRSFNHGIQNYDTFGLLKVLEITRYRACI